MLKSLEGGFSVNKGLSDGTVFWSPGGDPPLFPTTLPTYAFNFSFYQYCDITMYARVYAMLLIPHGFVKSVCSNIAEA